MATALAIGLDLQVIRCHIVIPNIILLNWKVENACTECLLFSYILQVYCKIFSQNTVDTCIVPSSHLNSGDTGNILSQ